jgi:hypothetical protein
MQIRGIATVALFVLATGAAARATTLVPVDVATLAREARTIARGSVVRVESQWMDGRRGMETIVMLQVESSIKGPSAQTVRFRVPGGQLGRYRHVVVGAPVFGAGQRVVVFLSAEGATLPHVLGFNQGVFRVASQSGALVVVPPPYMSRAALPARIVRGDPSRRAMALGDFEREVRRLAEVAR